MTTIYALQDPFTRHIRYVGKSKQVQTRYKSHFKDNSNKEKAEWMYDLIYVKDSRPNLLILDEVDSDANFWELHYINLYQSWGFNLFNKVTTGTKEKNIGINTIRDIPWDVYCEIQEIATKARRSMNSQLIIQLEKSIKK